MSNLSNKAYELVTNAIIEGLEKGRVAWHRPWSVLKPFNPISNTVYKGVNTFILGMFSYNDPRWMTFNQIEKAGGKIRKGEKGTPIVFWKHVSYEDKETGDKKSFPLLKYFYVWNVEQTEGLELPKLESMSRDNKPIEACEDLLRLMPNPPALKHGGGRACYSPSADVVTMPHMQTFESAEAYYSTAFHEYVHSTGHSSRLNRPELVNSDGFGGTEYSREELVAELGAAFLCQVVGIDNDQENSTAYISGWLKAFKNDPQMIVWAAGRASKAADYIQGLKFSKEEATEQEESKELATV